MQILDAANVVDQRLWLECLYKLPMSNRDIHFHPDYLRAYAWEEECRALCGVYGDGFLVPFVLRGHELGNVYCYGSNSRFLSYNYDWLLEHVAVERIRYRSHPFLWQYGEKEKLIVYMDLQDDFTKEFRKGHRSSIMLAHRSGVKVEESDDIPLFHRMYEAMCARNDATDYWRFSISLLARLHAAFPEGFRILIASVDGEPEAGCVLLGAFDTAYYQYAASFGLHRNIGVGNLLVVEAANLAKKLGYKRLHLGGGMSAEPHDTLLRFKTGFSKRRCWVYQYNWQAKAEAA